ncbi:MAG: transposase family protein [Firmicutes bacterium]|nr:transposase family protein [Bacillota bacterium]
MMGRSNETVDHYSFQCFYITVDLPRKLFLDNTPKIFASIRNAKELAFEFEVGESTAHDVITWVENTLVKCKKFRLPDKKALISDDIEIEVILIDATASPIERPKKEKPKKITTAAKRKNTP